MFMAAEFGINSKHSMISSNIILPYREMEVISAALPLNNWESNCQLCQGSLGQVRPHGLITGAASGRGTSPGAWPWPGSAEGPACQPDQPALHLAPSPWARLLWAIAAGTSAHSNPEAPPPPGPDRVAFSIPPAGGAASARPRPAERCGQNAERGRPEEPRRC